MSNGSFFGYVYGNGKKLENSDEEEMPTEISAFYGTFLVTCFMIVFSIAMLILENRKPAKLFQSGFGDNDRFPKMKEVGKVNTVVESKRDVNVLTFNRMQFTYLK